MGSQKLEVREMPPDMRPREMLFSKGAGYLSDRELISIIIGSGIKGKGISALSNEVLEKLDKLNYQIEGEALSGIAGIGKARIAVLSASIEFSRRILCPKKKKISAPGDVYPIIKHYADRMQELFLSLSLNGAHEIIAVRTVSIGLLNKALVHPREVFADPLKDRAAAVIVCHNHPSGNIEPSSEDMEVTKRLMEAGDVLGVPLLDHIIFSETGFYSILAKDKI